MAAGIKLSGEITRTAEGFVVKTEITVPTMAEAQAIGSSIQELVEQKVAALGGKLVRDEPAEPGFRLIRPN